MKKYHKYVFDTEKRLFIGDFEGMYQAESEENFDSWHQEDMRPLARQVTLAMAARYHFGQVIDLGCGKGAFTHLLKKANNQVFGTDIAPTAITMASERFPDICFSELDLSDLGMVKDYLEALPPAIGSRMVHSGELLSYMENWCGLIELVARHTDYFLCQLHLPPDPIGFVKSHAELSSCIASHFDVEEEVILKKSSFQITFARKKGVERRR